MRLFALILAVMVGFAACSGGNNDQKEKAESDSKDQEVMKEAEASQEEESGKKYDTVHYGEKIDEASALSFGQMLEKMGDKKEYEAKVKGEVTKVCQKKGCWMKIKNPKGEDVRVSFKDYGFFVPKDLAGNEVVMEGRAYYDTIPVKARKHLARDEGKSEEEIKKIDEPKQTMVFKANGVKILQ